ncbi:MAG: hypothetical protein CM1200mP26_14820 [Acidimicrobiales bacterium]|nr:MAG: hypothetical protein CM1200mP26_14820 [Acidimicrobiales bacterium]
MDLNDDRSTEGAVVEALLGRRPEGAFEVVVRDDGGNPVVIRNHPLLDDGRPMPTRFWLVESVLRSRIGTLESIGGVRDAEAACDSVELVEATSGTPMNGMRRFPPTMSDIDRPVVWAAPDGGQVPARSLCLVLGGGR